MKAFSSKEFLGIMDMVLFDEDIPELISYKSLNLYFVSLLILYLL